jgi:hypothetical protein
MAESAKRTSRFNRILKYSITVQQADNGPNPCETVTSKVNITVNINNNVMA